MPRDMVEIETPVDLASPAQVRARWIEELRRQGDRQCYGAPFGENNTVCAMVLLGQVMKLEGTHTLGAVGNASGLSGERVCEIINRNDGRLGYRKHTFAEIADVVEGWFK